METLYKRSLSIGRTGGHEIRSSDLSFGAIETRTSMPGVLCGI